MSNLLKATMIDFILSLHGQGLSQRRIASELGINRETISRHLSQLRDASKPADAPPGSIEAAEESKPANAPHILAAPLPGTNSDLSPRRLVLGRVGHRRGHRSECEPWRDVIQAKCDLGLSA
jgi:hypothetical protein